MTAPVLNVNLAAAGAAASAQAGAAAHGKGKAVGLEGFEAVFAALFGQAAGAAPTPLVSPKHPALGATSTGDAEPDAQGTAEPQTDVADGPQDPTAPAAVQDPTLALLANAAAGKPADTPADPKAASGEGVTPPAYGRDKAKGTPAAPALANANPHARLADKAGLTTPASEASPETPGPDTAEAGPATPAPAHPEKPGRPALALAVPAAASQPVEATVAPDAKAAPQPDAAALDTAVTTAAAEAEPPATEAKIPLPETASPIAQLAARAAPPGQPARGAPTSKGERFRDSVEAPAGPKSASAPRASDAATLDTTVARAPAADKDAADASARGPQAADAPDSATVQADAPPPASGPAPTQHAAHTPVRGAPETVATLAAQIVKKLENRSTRFNLELNPAGLGKVDVRLEIAASGQISAAMTFDTPQAAAELKARAGELQRALEQAGFNLSGGMSFDVAGDRGQSQQGWQQAQEQAGHGLRGRAFREALNTAGDAADQAVSGALRLRRGLSSALDVRI